MLNLAQQANSFMFVFSKNVQFDHAINRLKQFSSELDGNDFYTYAPHRVWLLAESNKENCFQLVKYDPTQYR